jgi:hypothetical protein
MIKNFFTENIQQKLLALVAAVLIWVVVDHSISTTKVFVNVPVRVVNLPTEKTIRGLMPNGILDRKIAVTLTGTKDVIDQIEPGDFEVVLDAFGKPDDWIVEIAKKNLVSLNPDIDLIHNVTALSYSPMVIKLSKLVTDKIPVYIEKPKGEPPEGYQFLDVWPRKISHIVSGPEEDVLELKNKGLELVFDLADLTKEDLDSIVSADPKQPDEISYFVPENWKKIQIPFLHDVKQEVNGPESRHLRIDFLKKDLLTLNQPLPVSVFYPLANSNLVNPETHPLSAAEGFEKRHEIVITAKPLFVDGISRLFLDLVKDRIQLVVVAETKDSSKPLQYAIDFVDWQRIENSYIALFKELPQNESYFRSRFRTYMCKMALYEAKDTPFVAQPHLLSSSISIQSK